MFGYVLSLFSKTPWYFIVWIYTSLCNQAHSSKKLDSTNLSLISENNFVQEQ